MTKRYWMVAGLLMLVIALVACSNDDDQTKIEDSVELVVPTLPARTLVETCTDPDIENWADLVLPNTNEFKREAQSFATRASNTEEGALEITWVRLIVLRDAVASYPTPTCLDRPHDQLLARLQSVLGEYQSFGIGRSTVADLQEGVASELNSLDEQVRQLNRVMAELYNNN